MKRSSYFISARSESADILAAELVLAMNDQFPKVECIGILGGSTSCTRSTPVGRLADCLKLELHEETDQSKDGIDWFENLVTQLIAQSPEVAILVGYSFFHHRLALFFNSQNIPVVLYEITPASAVESINPVEIGQRIKLALGFSPVSSQMVKNAKIPYFYVGSPYKDRVDRVILGPEALGFSSGKKIVSIFPGNHKENYQTTLPAFQKLAESLAQIAEAQVVISVPDSLLADESIRILGERLYSAALNNSTASGRLCVMAGAQLELLSLSSLAVTGCGAITLECGLLQLPLMPVFSGNKQSEPQSMINQVAGKYLVPEYSSSTSTEMLCTMAKQLIFPSPTRDSMVSALGDARLSLQGFAAENAAEYIGLEIGNWKQGKRFKGSKSA